MIRLLAILCLCVSLTSCESMWLSAYRHQGGYGVKFSQPLLIPIKYQGKELYQNVRDWTVTVNGHDFTIKKGRVVDGASVPRLFWFFMPPDGLHRGAALFHDEGYEYRGHFPDGFVMTKDEIDEGFYNIQVEAGVGKRRSGIAYEGVHLFGQPAWDSIEEPLILPVEIPMGQRPIIKRRNMFSHIYQ